MIGKKVFATVLSLIVLAGIFTGCSGEIKESGKIGQAEAEQGSADETGNVFTPVKEDLGYEYMECSLKRGYMKFNVPKNWKVERINARHIEITSPEDDSLIPGQTVQVFVSPYIKGEMFTLSDSVQYFHKELKTCAYYINGKAYTYHDDSQPDTLDTDTSFTGGRNDITLLAVQNAPYLNDSYREPAGSDTVKYDYYVDWADTPCVFSSVASSKTSGATKKLLRYMVSSITFQEQQPGEVKTIKSNGTSFSIPKEFEEVSSNLYQVPNDRDYLDAGIAISVYKINTLEYDKFSMESINSSYGKAIGSACLGIYANNYDDLYNAVPPPKDRKLANYDTEYYQTNVVLNLTEDTKNKYYLDAENMIINSYVINSGDEQYVISIWYQLTQTKIAYEIAQILESSFKIA